MFLEQRITQDIDEIILLIDDYISKFEQFHSLIQEATDAHMLAMSVEGMNVSVWNILHVYDHMIGKLHDLDLSGSLHCKKEQESVLEDSDRIKTLFYSWEKACNEYETSGSPGNPADTRYIMQWQQMFLEHETFMMENRVKMEKMHWALERVKKEIERQISMACVYAPPEIMFGSSVEEDNSEVYPVNHAVVLNDDGIEDEEYIAEVYASSKMMMKNADSTYQQKVDGVRFCMHCGENISEKTIFCPYCGKQVQIICNPEDTIQFCRNCWENIPLVARFCPWCGNDTRRIPKEEEMPMGPVYASPEILVNKDKREKRTFISKLFKKEK